MARPLRSTFRKATVFLLGWSAVGQASLEEDGVWEGGLWASTVWEDGVWYEGAALVIVPDVVGEASFAAADAILEGVGLDGGTEIENCSAAPDNEIIAQDPLAGAEVELATLVNLTSSNGVECPGAAGGRKGLSMPGIQFGF